MEPSRKAITEQRRKDCLKTLEGIFRRSYEMSRAWGIQQERARRFALEDVLAYMIAEMERVPQDKSFLSACLSDFKEQVPEIIKQEEA